MVVSQLMIKNKNQTEMFRFLDIRGKGKVKKAEFIIAAGKARISLSREDMGKVFHRIDASKQGYITYHDICITVAQKPVLDARNEVGMTERAAKNLFTQNSPEGGSAKANDLINPEKPFGVTNLPSDNMNFVMQNQFANEYASH